MNCILLSWAVWARLTSVTDRQTDRLYHSKCHASLRCSAKKAKIEIIVKWQEFCTCKLIMLTILGKIGMAGNRGTSSLGSDDQVTYTKSSTPCYKRQRLYIGCIKTTRKNIKISRKRSGAFCCIFSVGCHFGG